MKLMPNIDCPRTASTPGAASSVETMGYVTWSSTRSGLRPIHSVQRLTCGSERSGIASNGTLRTATIAPSTTQAEEMNTSAGSGADMQSKLHTMSRTIDGYTCGGVLHII